MSKPVGIGYQDFGQLIQNDCFYIDKTGFIKEWWERLDAVTLITRPRRFGKTLTMSMTEQFFLPNMQGMETYSRDFPYGRKKNIVYCREHVRLSVFLLLM